MSYLDLDEELAELNRWILRAGKSLLSLFDPKRTPRIQVTNLGTTGIRSESTGQTSRSRVFVSMYEFLRWIDEESLSRDERFASREPTLAEVRSDVVAEILPLCEWLFSNDSQSAINQAEQLSINSLDALKLGDEHGSPHLLRHSHLLMAVALLQVLDHCPPKGVTDSESDKNKIHSLAQRAAKQASTVAEANVGYLAKWRGGKALKGDDPHDLITVHAVRAIDAFRAATGDANRGICDAFDRQNPPPERNLTQALRERSLKYAPRLIGYDAAGVSSKTDPTELAFTVALLGRFGAEEAGNLCNAAIQCIAVGQTDDGSWPLTRLVSYFYDGHNLVHPSSYEVALELAHLLSRKVIEGDRDSSEKLRSICQKTVELTKASYKEMDLQSGWSNDHATVPTLLESWSTAVVLQFLIHYRDSLLAYRQRHILARYGYHGQRPIVAELSRTGQQAVDLLWPDMRPTFQSLQPVAARAIAKYEDPTPGEVLRTGIQQLFVGPIASSWTRRPSARSLILYGDPGTGKSSLVRYLAEDLGWPLLVLSPPNFLHKGGIDGFEAAANEIFNDLMRLRRVVVLFDECEEFFRERQHRGKAFAKERASRRHAKAAKTDRKAATTSDDDGTESVGAPGVDARPGTRTTGAFITSGMLPRLEALREQGWVIFVLATNNELTDIDGAVRRPGRFDRSQRVSHPDLAAQRRFLSNRGTDYGVQNDAVEALISAVDQYDEQRAADEYPGNELQFNAVSYGVLRLLLEEAAHWKNPTAVDALARLNDLANEEHPVGLENGLRDETF